MRVVLTSAIILTVVAAAPVSAQPYYDPYRPYYPPTMPPAPPAPIRPYDPNYPGQYRRPVVTPTPRTTPPARQTPRSTPRTTQQREPSRAEATPTPRATPTPAAAAAVASTISGPAVITRPGMYRLDRNVTSASDATTAVIVVRSGDVTVDLGGYLIAGGGASHPDAHGVAILADNVTVRNGSLRGFTGQNQCAVVVGEGVTGFRVEDLQIRNSETGILLNPDNNTARTPQAGLIRGCAISDASVGILGFASDGVQIVDVRIAGCVTRSGYDGEGSGMILRGAGYQIRDCSLVENEVGLRIDSDHTLVAGVTCFGNRRAGIQINGSNVTVRDSDLSGNRGDGVVVQGRYASIEDSQVCGNGGAGIVLGTAGNQSGAYAGVKGCTVAANGAEGVISRFAGAAVIEESRFMANGTAGLSLQSNDVVRNCVLNASGGQRTGGVDGGGNLEQAAGVAGPAAQ